MDLIKREDAIKAMADYLDLLGVARRYAKSVINKVPSAEKQGEWLFKEITDDYHITGQCSVCKERRRIDNFCPNCGCRMKGADDEHDK